MSDCLLKVKTRSKNAEKFKSLVSDSDMESLNKEMDRILSLEPKEQELAINEIMDAFNLEAKANFKRKIASIQALDYYKYFESVQDKSKSARQVASDYLNSTYNQIEASFVSMLGNLERSLGEAKFQTLYKGKSDLPIMEYMHNKLYDTPMTTVPNADERAIGDILIDHINHVRKVQTDAGATIEDVWGYLFSQTHNRRAYSSMSLEDFRKFADQHYDKERMMKVSTEDTWDDTVEGIYKRVVSGEHAKQAKISETDYTQIFSNRSIAKGLEAERKIFYKDGKSSFEGMRQLGHAKSLFDSMVTTTNKAARVSTLLSRLGDNVEGFKAFMADKQGIDVQARVVSERGTKLQRLKSVLLPDKHKSFQDRIGDFVASNDKKVDVLTGAYDGHTDDIPTEMRWMQMLIEIQPTLKLGGAAISSLGDVVMGTNAMLNRGVFTGTGGVDAVTRQMPSFLTYLSKGKEGRDMAKMTHRAAWNRSRAVNRYMSGLDAGARLEWLNNFSMKINGLERMDFASKMAATDMLEEGMGTWSSKSFNELLATNDGKRFASYLRDAAISPDMWDVIRHAGVDGEDFSSFTVDAIADLTIDDFDPLFRERGLKKTETNFRRLKRDVELNVLDFFTNGKRNAVPEPSLTTRSVFTWGPPDSFQALIGRSMGQFKGFPLELVRQLVKNSNPHDKPGTMLFTAMAMAELTAMGYVTWSIKEAIKGKTPPDPLNPKVILTSMARGGAAGPLADVILRDWSKYGDSTAAIVAGPAVGDLDAYGRGAWNIVESIATGNTEKTTEELKKLGVRVTPNYFWLEGGWRMIEQMAFNQYGMLWSETHRRNVERIMDEQGQDTLYKSGLMD